MISHMIAVTHSTPIGEVFKEKLKIALFESDVTLCTIFDSFIQHTHDFVIITQESVHVGILTIKDMLRILEDFENLFRPAYEFMVSPLLTFDAAQTIEEVLEKAEKQYCGKIIVHENNTVVGAIDYNDLLAICFKKITALINDEYNMLRSVAAIADNGNKELIKMATTDSLTGIGNRRLFEEVFQAHQLVIGKYHPKLHVLVFDVDNFKRINDTYGHSIGDSVLQELAELVSNAIRKSDVFVRWGGEEFALLLRYCDAPHALKIADDLCTLIQAHRFVSVNRVTCSFGLSEIQSTENIQTVMERADKALYKAKSEGKNCVRVEGI